ncbi:hypothetical protein ACH4S8_43750 [Streptomyces sp. NPDC021080]
MAAALLVGSALIAIAVRGPLARSLRTAQQKQADALPSLAP